MANYPTSLDNDGTMLIATNFCRSTLNTSMTNVQNTCILVDASTFPVPSGGGTYYVVIDAVTSASREIIGYTGITTNTLTGVSRGQGGTTGLAHTAGVLVEQNIVSFYHENIKAAILAIETKAGIDASAVNTTFDFKLSEVTGGDKSVGKTATQTVTNKTMTSPILNTPSMGTSVTITTTTFSVIPGATSFTFKNNANTQNNMVIADNGDVTFRATVSGITTLTATTLAGTLSTAAQANVTSLGTLTSLTVTGVVTVNTGAITVNTAGNATFNRQYLSAKFAVAFSATPTYDFNNGNVQSTTLTGVVTSSTFSNGISGGRYVLILTQDGTGGRTVVWPASVKWGGGTAPTLSGSGKIDVFGFVYDGTSYLGTAGLNF